MRVGRRVPDGVVDAVQDTGDDVGANAQQSVERHTALRCADLGGIGRRDGGDAVGELQSCLQEADASEIFDAVDRETPRREHQARQQCGGKVPLEGEVVNRDHGRRPRRTCVVEISGRQSGLPVVSVNDGGPIAVDQALPDVGGDARERREALCIVRPVAAGPVDVWVAGPRVEMRRVENQEIELPAVPARSRAGPPKRSPNWCRDVTSASFSRTARIARDKRAQGDALSRQAPPAARPRHRRDRRS